VSSPTQRSLKHMRDQGYYAEVVERFNSFTKRRHDLFGFIDILCIKEGEVVGVQTTSYGHISDRRQKILEHENYAAVKASGIKIIVHGWIKRNNRWQVKEVELSDTV
jgi:hypothetical protein